MRAGRFKGGPNWNIGGLLQQKQVATPSDPEGVKCRGKSKENQGCLTAAGPIDEAITPSPAQPQPVIPVIVIIISEKPI